MNEFLTFIATANRATVAVLAEKPEAAPDRLARLQARIREAQADAEEAEIAKIPDRVARLQARIRLAERAA